MNERDATTYLLDRPPSSWRRLGPQLPRGPEGSFDSHVTGDPCIVWDETLNRYRMFYFAMGGQGECCNAQAVAAGAGRELPTGWEKLGPVDVVNPDAYNGNTHKPYVLMDPRRPNEAFKLDGAYWLFSATYVQGQKVIHLARAASLAGPWTVQAEPVVSVGSADEFDGLHADSVTAWWFEQEGRILLFYKGYPRQIQADQQHSPVGSSLAAAVLRPGETAAQKLGPVLRPAGEPGHWTAGWVGPLQLLPAGDGGWWGLMSASPTPPAPVAQQPRMREPAPSMGGWAYTPQAWPVDGWKPLDQPIEHVHDIPPEAMQAGEGVNLWRHHALVLPGGALAVYYNSGPYGRERMFGKLAAS